MLDYELDWVEELSAVSKKKRERESKEREKGREREMKTDRKREREGGRESTVFTDDEKFEDSPVGTANRAVQSFRQCRITEIN